MYQSAGAFLIVGTGIILSVLKAIKALTLRRLTQAEMTPTHRSRNREASRPF
jgi:hypothetical protein